MRVLQVNKFFYEKGGTERYFFSVSRALERRGHTVVHFSMRHPENLASPYSDYFVSAKEYADRGGKLDDVAEGFSFIRSREAAGSIARLIEETRPEIAHLHNIYHQITPSILPVLGRARVPVVMTLHDHKLVCPNYSLFDGKTYCYRCRGGRFHRAAGARCNQGSFARSLLLSVEAYWQRLTRVYDEVVFFLAPSRYMRDVFLAEGYSPERVVHVPPFVAGGGAEAVSAPGDVSGAAARALPERFILYFGRLGSEKGLFTLVDAVSGLKDVPLVLCGDGPLREPLEARAATVSGGRIRFTGHLAKFDLDAVIRRATAVVLPSVAAENAPYTVLEAMAAGIPAIVSNVGGLPELAEEGGGLVFEAGSAADLAAKIRGVWDNPALAQAMGEKGRRFVSDELTEDRHIARLEAVYRKAAEPR